MFQSKQPNLEDLPSSSQLIISTIIALFIAVLILTFFILPAEYGIDITGIGKLTGLKDMGNIKNEPIIEIRYDTVFVKEKVNNTDTIVHNPSRQLIKSDYGLYTLKPGHAVEVKLKMEKGDVVNYKWETIKGRLYYNLHGNGKQKKFISYKKGRMVESDKGEFTAKFDGSHGWFWKNQDKINVKVLLKVEGQYKKMNRVL